MVTLQFYTNRNIIRAVGSSGVKRAHLFVLGSGVMYCFSVLISNKKVGVLILSSFISHTNMALI